VELISIAQVLFLSKTAPCLSSFKTNPAQPRVTEQLFIPGCCSGLKLLTEIWVILPFTLVKGDNYTQNPETYQQ
jgi:hypothetical protein